jgi:glycosyltransferase involved in cell wall biosynthesis
LAGLARSAKPHFLDSSYFIIIAMVKHSAVDTNLGQPRRGAAIPPLISIITVVFRDREELSALIENVAAYKTEDIEYIVVDGGSKDGTVELLSQSSHTVDYWLSEPDKGIYDAMNKGIAAAQGMFIFHMNAGDRILDLPIQELREFASTGLDIAAFRVSVEGKKAFRPASGLLLRLKNTLHHQGTFYRREIFPAYDLRYKVFADFDVNQRLVKSGARIKTFQAVIASHMGGGVSDMQTKANVSEFFEIIRKNYGRSHLPPAWLICKGRGIKRRLSAVRRMMFSGGEIQDPARRY